jgi:glutathione S-transferase
MMDDRRDRAMYRLHGFCQSGNTFKVAFFLRMLDQPWEPVLVDFFAGQTRAGDWRARTNPMGEVPVLEADGEHLTQSGAILDWLAARHGPDWRGRTDAERHEVLRWLLFDNHKFTSYFATYRFMKAFGPKAPDPAVMAFLRTRIDGAFDVVERRLADHAFITGDAATIADVSLSGYLFYPVDESGVDVERDYPKIAGWRDRVRRLPGWVDPYDLLPKW